MVIHRRSRVASCRVHTILAVVVRGPDPGSRHEWPRRSSSPSGSCRAMPGHRRRRWCTRRPCPPCGRFRAPVTVDGRLDEAVWQARRRRGFRQSQPHGRAGDAADRGRFANDAGRSRGARMDDDLGAAGIARLARRDATVDGDELTGLRPYHDHRPASSSRSTVGVKYDAYGPGGRDGRVVGPGLGSGDDGGRGLDHRDAHPVQPAPVQPRGRAGLGVQISARSLASAVLAVLVHARTQPGGIPGTAASGALGDPDEEASRDLPPSPGRVRGPRATRSATAQFWASSASISSTG